MSSNADTQTCGACLFPKATEEFFRKQRNKGKVGRCQDCVERSIPVDSNLWAEFLQTKAEAQERHQEALEETDRQDEIQRQSYESESQTSIQFLLDHPVAPAHPDEGKEFTPDQTFEVKSGGFCFGLRHNVQEAAAAPLQSFDEVAMVTSDKCRPGTPAFCNTVAENGIWNAYNLISRTNQFGESRCGWLICRQGLDPALEARQLIYHAVSNDLSGNGTFSGSGRSLSHQRNLGYAVFPRYIIGTTYEFSEEEAQPIREEGLCLVDYEQAQVKGKAIAKWTNAIRGMQTDGEYDVAGLSYTRESKCKAFLLYGNHLDFKSVYFRKGTAPLGQQRWEEKCRCPEHGFTDRSISVNQYLKRSKTQICLNTIPYWSMMGLEPPAQRMKGEAYQERETRQQTITQFFKPAK